MSEELRLKYQCCGCKATRVAIVADNRVYQHYYDICGVCRSNGLSKPYLSLFKCLSLPPNGFVGETLPILVVDPAIEISNLMPNNDKVGC